MVHFLHMGTLVEGEWTLDKAASFGGDQSGEEIQLWALSSQQSRN